MTYSYAMLYSYIVFYDAPCLGGGGSLTDTVTTVTSKLLQKSNHKWTKKNGLRFQKRIAARFEDFYVFTYHEALE